MEGIGSTIITVLVSSLMATIVTLIVNGRREKHKIKVELLTKIIGKMNQLTPRYTGEKNIPEYLNQVYIVYNDCDEVLRAIDALKNNINNGHMDEYFIKLIKAMCDDTHMEYKGLNDSFISTPFT